MMFLRQIIPLFAVVLTTSMVMAAEHCDRPAKKNCTLLTYNLQNVEVANNFQDEPFKFTCDPGTANNGKTTVLSILYSPEGAPRSFLAYVYPAEKGPIWVTVDCTDKKKEGEDSNIVHYKPVLAEHTVAYISCEVEDFTVEEYKESVKDRPAFTVLDWTTGLGE